MVLLLQIILVWLGLGPACAHAGNTFYPLVDARVDMALKLKLIENARHSIRIVSYDFRPDDAVGMPMLFALREAANRDVKIWFIQGKVSALFNDRYDLTTRMIADPALKRPAKHIVFGAFDNLRQGWNIFDSVHEKIFIIDDEIAITGGRNYAKDYLSWLDSDWVIKGPLVSDFISDFGKLWREVSRYESPRTRSTRDGLFIPTATEKNSRIALSSEQQTQLDNVFATSYAPESARLIANRFFTSLATGKYSGKNRANIPDAIVDALADAVKGAKDIRVSTLYVLFHPKLKNALIKALHDGARLTLFFNGLEASAAVVPFGLSYAGSLSEIYDLMSTRRPDGTPADVRAVAFQKLKDGSNIYLHKKIFIADNHVFVGSHNFNLPSTIFNSEASIEINDAAFAEAMRREFDVDLANSGKPLTIEDVKHDYDRTAVGRWFARYAEGMF